MIEIVKHLFGFCGEPHLNVFHIIVGSIPGISYITLAVKSKLNKK